METDAEYLLKLVGDYDGRNPHPIGDRLREIAARLRPTPVSERLPRIDPEKCESERMLAYIAQRNSWFSGSFYQYDPEEDVKWQSDWPPADEFPTHWLPIPPSPSTPATTETHAN